MFTYAVGYAGSAAGAKAMAQYLLSSTLDQKLSAAARYYAGEMPPLLSAMDELGQSVHRGEVEFSNALDELVRDAIDKLPPGAAFDIDQIEERLTVELEAAVTRADFTEEQAPTNAKLRPDLSPKLAKALGIDPALPLTESGIANLLDLRKLDGGLIDGKRINKPMRSLVDIFGLDPDAVPTGQALANVLAGRRADGQGPRTANGKAMKPEELSGPLKRFHTAMGVKPGKDPTSEQLANITAGKAANGFDVSVDAYQRQVHAVKAPIGYVDATFSADKTLSVAWALAKTEVERAAILTIHEKANLDGMAFLEKNIGFATKGANGKDGVEPAKMAWVSFQHFTARPTLDVAMTDKAGVEYTQRAEIRDPTVQADPNIHTHNAVLATVMTKSGRVASLDLQLLDGLVHQAGAVYQARVAHYARELGIAVAAGPNGETRFTAVDDGLRDLFSKRTVEANAAARDLAAKKGLAWDGLNGQQKIGLLKAGAGVTRNKKHNPGTVPEAISDFDGWSSQAKAAGYDHQTVLRPDAVVPQLYPDQRQALAYQHSLEPLSQKFEGTTSLNENELKVQAIRGFINAGGIGADAMAEIDGVMKLYRKHGVRQDGELTTLEWGKDVPVRGKDVVTVTTSLHADQERELVSLMRAAAADKSSGLTPAQLDRAADAFLQCNPKIDPDGAQWKAQREMMTKLAAAGRFSVAIGAAGAGKSTVIAPLFDAWKADGRTVYGAALANRQATDLAAAGIPAEHRSSIAAFLWRVDHGRYDLNDKSVVVVDEVSLLSTRDQLSLLRLQAKHGFTLAEVGDFSQMQSVDASGGLSLVRRALPDIPEVVTSIRQKLESERENVSLLRNGEVGEVLARKQADGTLLMVAGGRERTVERVAQLWQERQQANRGDTDYTLSVSTVSNRDVMELGAAIRTVRRRAGELGPDVMTLNAADVGGNQYKLGLGIGDKVRLFDRVHDAAKGGRDKVLANNGSIVEVIGLSKQGMMVKNAEGETGTVLWDKLRKKSGDPIRLTYGYAMTRNLAQGITSTEHIDAPLDGSKSTNVFSAYVSMSRHKLQTWMVLNEGAIRRSIAAKQVDGAFQAITPGDVLRRAAEDMNRKPECGSALDVLDRITDQQRGTLVGFQRGMEPVVRQSKIPGLSAFQDFQLSMSPVIRQVQDYVQDLKQRYSRRHQAQPQGQSHTHQHRPRGPSMSL